MKGTPIMSDTRILDVIRRIVEADPLPSTFAVAVRLALRISPENGQVNLTWDEYLALCDCTDRDNARRHLITLGRRKLIHYSTNDNVYVTWLAWLMDDMNYQPVRAPSKNAFQNAKNARENADSVVGDSKNCAPS